ncbi:hypothetical protein BDV09DRAFT_203283 [Aspergillus tetrazonus]
MLPTFHMNNFKPWAPPPAKSFSLRRTPSICSPSTQNSPHPRPSHALPPSTLPLPKHHLPARPPAEVCMNVSASSQPCTPSNSQTQIREISRLESEQTRGLSSPSISSPNDSIEEFLRLPEAQDDNGWEDLDLQPHAPEADSLITTEKACPPINHSRDPDERVAGGDSDTQTMHPCPHSTNPKVSLPKGVPGNNNAAKPRSRKRKIQESDSQDPKRLRARSRLPLQEDSFTALQSHFISLPLDDRALSCCTADTSLSACEGREARATCCSSPQHEMEQNPGACRKGQRSSRKRMPWSTEEANLLLRLRREEKRPWAEVTRLFSEEFPGRSSGAIQVYWSTNLSKRED